VSRVTLRPNGFRNKVICTPKASLFEGLLGGAPAGHDRRQQK